jgi:hypothetical protein
MECVGRESPEAMPRQGYRYAAMAQFSQVCGFTILH